MKKIWLQWLIYVAMISILTITLAIISIPIYTEISKPVTTGNRQPIEKGHFIYDRQLGWRLYPNNTVYLIDAKESSNLFFSTNERGFRNSSFQTVDDDTPSVLLLGDSAVQGYFLADDETVSSSLGRKIGKNVFNAGVGGYSTDQEYAVLKELLNVYQFDWVILFFSLNDLEYLDQNQAWGMPKYRYQISRNQINFEVVNPPTFTSEMTTNSDFEMFDINKSSTYGRQVSLHGSTSNISPAIFVRNVFGKTWTLLDTLPSPTKLFQLMLSQIEENKYRHFVLGHEKDYFDHPDEGIPRRQWNLVFQFLDRMRSLTEEQQGQFVVFFNPELAQIVDKDSVVDYYGNYLTKGDLGEKIVHEVPFRPQWYFLELCTLYEISCIDPHKRFLRARNRNSLYFLDDGHWSPFGAELAAEIVARHIFNYSGEK